jgi:hypothetical protein
MMFWKGPLGAFGFLQEYASFVEPKPAIEKPANTTSINLACLFKFDPLVKRVHPAPQYRMAPGLGLQLARTERRAEEDPENLRGGVGRLAIVGGGVSSSGSSHPLARNTRVFVIQCALSKVTEFEVASIRIQGDAMVTSGLAH